MRNYIKSISLIATLMTASLVSYASSAPSPVGYWQTINKDTNRPSSIIQVYNAKAQVNDTTINGKILGTFVYGKKRSSPAPRCKKCEGQLENAPIVGLPILTGFKQAGKNSWQSGSLLSPKTGSTYDNVTLSLANNNQQLKVLVKVGFLSQTQTWHRISLALIKEIKHSEKHADFKLLMK